MTGKPLRILTVSHFFEAHGGGIERVAGHLCRRFADNGIETSWAASDADLPPEGKVDAVPIACLQPMEKRNGLPMPIPRMRGIAALARAVRGSDSVVMHDALYATSILAMVAAKIYRKRTVLVQHIASVPFSSRILRFAMALANRLVTRPMLRAADARVFISDTVRHELLGTPARHSYRLLFNGVDRSIFHPSRDSTGDGGSPARGRRVLFVGRYVEKKGLSVIRALATLRPDLEISLAGAGSIRPGAWGLGNVRDLGTRTPMELADLYRTADLLLLPSVGEGYPLVIQEAMACGLPVICGAPVHLADPDAAVWLRGVNIDLRDPMGSARRCADAIDGLALTDAERDAMAAHALAHYDWDKMARSVIALAGNSQAVAPTENRQGSVADG